MIDGKKLVEDTARTTLGVTGVIVGILLLPIWLPLLPFYLAYKAFEKKD